MKYEYKLVVGGIPSFEMGPSEQALNGLGEAGYRAISTTSLIDVDGPRVVILMERIVE